MTVTTGETPEAERTAARSGVYVYGVVRAGATRSIEAEGVSGRQVELVEQSSTGYTSLRAEGSSPD